MQLRNDVKRLCTSLRGLRVFKRGKETKRSKLEISQPFNFKREITTLPGLSEDEISVLREQAAASCVGIAEAKTEHDNRHMQQQHHIQTHSPHHTRSHSRNGTRSRSTSASPQRPNGYGQGQGQQHYATRPPTSRSQRTNSLVDQYSAGTSSTQRPYPLSRSYTPGAGSTRSNRSGNGNGNGGHNSRCASPMSMSTRSLNRLVLPSLTSSSANDSGANSDCDSPGVNTPGGNNCTATGLGIGKIGGCLQILEKLEVTRPVSPVSSLGSSDLDGDDRFFIGSPVSPLTPRASPRSGKLKF
ncbi:hypothetical protein V8F06_001922 [Rhypophila decipiens]